LPIPLDIPEPQDRMFPVPWLIDLDVFAINDYDNPPVTGYWDRFLVNENVAALLREGSVLIDADSIYDGTMNGFVYEVKEVSPTATAGVFLVKLTGNLQDLLQYFWVFPPRVEREADGTFIGYGEESPVVSCTQRTVTLD